MKQTTGLLMLLGSVLTVLVSGCTSSSSNSRRELVLADLERDIASQQAVMNPADRPEAPMAKPAAVTPSETIPPAGVGTAPTGAVPGRYMPLDTTGGSLTIQAESVLRITVVEDPGLSGSYSVNSLGGIQFGYVGPVILDNLTEQQAEAKISQILISREFHTATVTVKILRPSYDRVQIAGDVRRPGLIKLGAGDEVSLNNALNQVGGIMDTPWNTKVKVVRGGLNSPLAAYLPGEVYSLADAGRNPRVPDVMLRNNDAVFVQAVRQRADRGRGTAAQESRWVLVLGEVGRPGFYGFEGSERFTMMNLAFRMGGFPPYANSKSVRVIRTDKDGIEQEFRVNARKILEEGDPDLDFPLEPGDRVIVPSRGISLF